MDPYALDGFVNSFIGEDPWLYSELKEFKEDVSEDLSRIEMVKRKNEFQKTEIAIKMKKFIFDKTEPIDLQESSKLWAEYNEERRKWGFCVGTL